MRQIYILFLLLLPLLANAADSAQTLVSTALKQEPFIDAKTITNIPAGTAVEVLKRQGGWLQIKAGEAEGWVKLPAIKLAGSNVTPKKESGLATLFNLANTGRSGNNAVTVTTGIRGLSPEDLKNAKPAPEAVKKLDSYASNKREAQSFASAEKLQSKHIEYLTDQKSVQKSEGSASGTPFSGGFK